MADAAAETGITWYEQDVSAQDYNGSVRTLWPQPRARATGVGNMTEVTVMVPLRTGAMVSLPPGLSLEDLLTDIVGVRTYYE